MLLAKPQSTAKSVTNELAQQVALVKEAAKSQAEKMRPRSIQLSEWVMMLSAFLVGSLLMNALLN